MSSVPLDQLLDRPQLVLPIAGEPYGFSELPAGQLARLQSWIRQATPHPLQALKGQLDGLPAHVQESVAEAARVAALSWPPKIGTAAGTAALLSTEPGQIQAIAEGLSVHHPGLSDGQVRAIFRALRSDASRQAKRARAEGRDYDGEGQVKRIFAVLFGLDDPDHGDDDGPKA